jgi:hypothetical protein
VHDPYHVIQAVIHKYAAVDGGRVWLLAGDSDWHPQTNVANLQPCEKTTDLLMWTEQNVFDVDRAKCVLAFRADCTSCMRQRLMKDTALAGSECKGTHQRCIAILLGLVRDLLLVAEQVVAALACSCQCTHQLY